MVSLLSSMIGPLTDSLPHLRLVLYGLTLLSSMIGPLTDSLPHLRLVLYGFSVVFYDWSTH